MLITEWQYFLLFVSSYAVVGLLTPVMRKFAIKREILDRPVAQHKTHSSPVPYLGGVAIIIGIVFITYLGIFLSNFASSIFWLATSILVPAVAMGIVGLWDDIKSLRPFPRFIGQTLAGIVVTTLLIATENIGMPTGSLILDVFITIFWIVGICNSINFFDNLDGGAAGTIAISTTALTYLSISNDQLLIGALSLVVSGSTLGFLVWNRSPARIYMGDAGALFLGVLVATLSIRLKPNTETTFASFAIPILLLAVPILDTTVAVISRIMRKVSPFQGGKDHLSHRLIRSGFSRKSSAILLWSMSAFFCFLAILLTKLSSNYEIGIIFFATSLWVFLLIRFLQSSDS